MFLDETFRVKVGLAEMLKGGVIMDVTTTEQAVIAEKSGAVAVMALERVPAQIRSAISSSYISSPSSTMSETGRPATNDSAVSRPVVWP